MKAIVLTVLCLCLAWLVTTKRVLEIPDLDGRYPVVYEEICREDDFDQAFFKKTGMLHFVDGTVIRDYHRVERIATCGGRP